MTREERVEYINKIIAKGEPPFKLGDPYNMREPWLKFGIIVDDGYIGAWEWYSVNDIESDVTDYDIILALREIGEIDAIDFHDMFDYIKHGGTACDVLTGDEYNSMYDEETRKHTIYKNGEPQGKDADWENIFNAKYWKKPSDGVSGMTFSEALAAMKNGKCVRRASWKNTGYYYRIRKNDCLGNRFGEAIENSDGVLIVSISTDILLTNDWEICDTNKGV